MMMILLFLQLRSHTSDAINTIMQLLILRGAIAPCYSIKMNIGAMQIIICIATNSAMSTGATPLAFCGKPLCQAKPYVMYGIAWQRYLLTVATYTTNHKHHVYNGQVFYYSRHYYSGQAIGTQSARHGWWELCYNVWEFIASSVSPVRLGQKGA